MCETLYSEVVKNYDKEEKLEDYLLRKKMLAGENDFFPVSFSSASSKMQCLYNLEVNGRQEKVWRASQQNVGREGLRPDGGASLPAQSKFGSGLKPLSSFH